MAFLLIDFQLEVFAHTHVLFVYLLGFGLCVIGLWWSVKGCFCLGVGFLFVIGLGIVSVGCACSVALASWVFFWRLPVDGVNKEGLGLEKASLGVFIRLQFLLYLVYGDVSFGVQLVFALISFLLLSSGCWFFQVVGCDYGREF